MLARPAAAFFPEPGFYWNSGESGSGYAIELQDNFLFLSAYTYLPNSVKRFAKPQQLAGVLHDAGTEQVGWLSLAGGIITIHHGVVS